MYAMQPAAEDDNKMIETSSYRTDNARPLARIIDPKYKDDRTKNDDAARKFDQCRRHTLLD
jgi:hypothetical protein